MAVTKVLDIGIMARFVRDIPERSYEQPVCGELDEEQGCDDPADASKRYPFVPGRRGSVCTTRSPVCRYIIISNACESLKSVHSYSGRCRYLTVGAVFPLP